MATRLKNIQITNNPFLIFAPFLLLYVLLAFLFPPSGKFGDESRYLTYAEYILNGFQSYDTTAFDYLGNGPGYPIILTLFVGPGLPLICITLINAVMCYFSIILIFKSILYVASFRVALTAGLFWACYFNQFEYVMVIYTETFTVFLVSLLVFCLTKAFRQVNSRSYLLASGFIIGYIALTKSIFGYVLLCMLAGSLILYLTNRRASDYRKSILILTVAFATTLPYLFYTFHLTGKIFYWSTFGGNNLYWMSTPSKGEYGDWFRDPTPTINPASHNLIGHERSIMLNHQKDFEEFNKYEGVQRDEAFKKIAIENIQSHPFKFIQNCVANVGRILFNFPYSYMLQKPNTLIRIPFNGVILFLGLLCVVPTLKNWKQIPFPIRFLLLMALIYLGGSIFGSAETRMFTIIVPILLLYIGFMLFKTVRINMGKWSTHLNIPDRA